MKTLIDEPVKELIDGRRFEYLHSFFHRTYLFRKKCFEAKGIHVCMRCPLLA